MIVVQSNLTKKYHILPKEVGMVLCFANYSNKPEEFNAEKHINNLCHTCVGYAYKKGIIKIEVINEDI